MYKLLLSKKVTKFIFSLSPKQQKLIYHKFELLRTDPFVHSELDIKKMKYPIPVYRLRIGKLRFIYEIKQEELIIFVFTGGSRGDIYKSL
jgi:mRNA interferase RelE/StbE